MAESPYAPPGARVGDPLEPPRAKPRSIRIALACLWIALAFGAVSTAVNLPRSLEMVRLGAVAPAAFAVELLTVIVTFGLIAFVAVKVGAGRNWARWLYFVLYAFGTAVWVFALLRTPGMLEALIGAPLIAVSMVLQTTLQTVALACLFLPGAGEWFH